MTAYEWRHGAHVDGVEAAAAADELERIRKRDGLVKPPAVVQAAANPSSCLHAYIYEPDDVALQQRRLERARHLIAALVIRIEPGEDKLRRAFVNIVDEDNDSQGYVSLQQNDDPRIRSLILEQLLRDLRSLERRYGEVQGLRKYVSGAIKTVQRELDGQAELVAA